jgi:hypothetical protein
VVHISYVIVRASVRSFKTRLSSCVRKTPLLHVEMSNEHVSPCPQPLG